MNMKKTFMLTLFVLCFNLEAVTLDKALEKRIDSQLSKRLEFVSKNPVYSRLVASLQEGRKLLRKGKINEARTIFGDLLQDRKLSSYPEYFFAKYYLAITFYESKITYGALLYFVDIVEKEPVKIYTHDALARSIKIAQELKDDELVLYLASVISPNKVPRSLREEFRYFIAKDLYKKNKFKRSVTLLKSIPHKSRLYLAAQYLLGSIAIKVNNLKMATGFFKTISNSRSPVEYYEKSLLKDLGNLALARIFYEQKNYMMAIEYYKKIDRDSDYYPQALDESAWTLFKMGKNNEALAVLHSVHSPFFEPKYFLKSNMLRGAIFMDMCHFDQARNSLARVENEFITLGNQIDAFATQARDPREYYPLLTSKTIGLDNKSTYVYKTLFVLAGANRDFFGVHNYIKHLGKERSTLEAYKSSRASILINLIRQKETELIQRASYLAGEKLLLTRKLVQDFINIRDTLRLEIVTLERKILQSRSLRLASPILLNQELIKPEFTESLQEKLIWWDYTGEYWEDELGYYLYSLKSLCKTPSKSPARPGASSPVKQQPLPSRTKR